MMVLLRGRGWYFSLPACVRNSHADPSPMSQNSSRGLVSGGFATLPITTPQKPTTGDQNIEASDFCLEIGSSSAADPHQIPSCPQPCAPESWLQRKVRNPGK